MRPTRRGTAALAAALALALLLGGRSTLASEAPPFEIVELGAYGPGEGDPVEGGEVSGTALLVVHDFRGTLLVEWRLRGDGRSCGGLRTLDVEPGLEVPLACTFADGGPRPARVEDAIVLTVSDGGTRVASDRAPFTWERLGPPMTRPAPTSGSDAAPPSLRVARDRIRSAGFANASRKGTPLGEPGQVAVVVQTAAGLPGLRTLSLFGRGRHLVDALSFDSEGGETLTQSFVVPTSALGQGRHRFKAELTDPNGRKDRKLVRLRVAAPPPPPGAIQGPLPDVSCLDETISLSVYHDGSEGADLIQLAIDGERLGTPLDVASCTAEQGVCVDLGEFSLHPGERVAISILVVEEGGGAPGSSFLELYGQCVPDVMSWPLGGGESTALWVERPLDAPTDPIEDPGIDPIESIEDPPVGPIEAIENPPVGPVEEESGA